MRPAVLLAMGALAGCGDTPLSAIDAASESARHVADVWYIMAWGAAGILMLMLLLTAFAVLGKQGSGRMSARRGRCLILGGGVLFPVAVMTALLVYAYAMAPSHGEAGYRVQVTGHQWWWEVRYPDAKGGARYSFNELHIPAGVPVEIQLQSADVIHGFWVPKLGGKMDAIPGRTNHIVYVAAEPGVYLGTCAEYCGVGHAVMQLQVTVHPPDALDAILSALPTKEGARP